MRNDFGKKLGHNQKWSTQVDISENGEVGSSTDTLKKLSKNCQNQLCLKSEK